jgi:hypothetical protein
MLCAICASTLEEELEYPGYVCDQCDRRAVGAAGQEPSVEPWRDSGENPVFVDGKRCYRRYRFGGWVTMLDECDCECRDVIEFQDMHITGERMREAVLEAIGVLEQNGKPVRGCFDISGRPVSSSSTYRGAVFESNGRRTAVVRTALVSSNARLLDSAVAHRIAERADFVIAILDPPSAGAASDVTDEYRAQYTAWAWHALRVAWVTADQIARPWNVAPTAPPRHQDWLDDLKADVTRRLTQAGPFSVGADSRRAEALVLPSVGAALVERGFEPASRTSYPSFWRHPKADGVWARQGASPNRIALEVKVTEDAEAPFCQVMENLGASDCVLYVRILNNASERARLSLQNFSPQALEERNRFEGRAPVRYLDIEGAE